MRTCCTQRKRHGGRKQAVARLRQSPRELDQQRESNTQKKTKKAEPNREDDSRQRESPTVRWGRKRLWRKCDVYKIIFAHFLTFVSLLFVCFFPLQGVVFQLLTSPPTVQPDQWGWGGEVRRTASSPHVNPALRFLSKATTKRNLILFAPPSLDRPNPPIPKFCFLQVPLHSCLKILLHSPAPTFPLGCWFYVCCDTGRGTGLSTLCIKEGMSKPLCHGPRDN